MSTFPQAHRQPARAQICDRRVMTRIFVSLVLLFLLAGCGSTSTSSPATTVPVTPSAAAATPTPTGVGATVGSVGERFDCTGANGERWSLQLVSVKDYVGPHGSMSLAPVNGEYVVADISVIVTAGTYNANPLYFSYQTADARTYTMADGHAFDAEFKPSFQAMTLSAGQRLRGFVVFDVPKGSGASILINDSGAQWSL
jgi:hypothetical protein